MFDLTPPDLPKFIVYKSGKNRYVRPDGLLRDPEKQCAYRTEGDSKYVGRLFPVNGKDDCWEIVFNINAA